MRQLVSRLQALLNVKERRLAYGVLGLIILAGFIDALGVSSILPFMSVVGNPQLIQTNPWLHHLFTGWEFESTDTFLIGLGLASLVVLVFSNTVSLVSSSAILWFAFNLGHSLSVRMLLNCMRQPYAYFLEHNSSDLVLNCTDDVARVVSGIIVPTLQGMAKLCTAASILLLVVWIDPWLAVLLGTVIGTVYAVVFIFMRHKVADLGRASKIANHERFRLAREILEGIKELKVLGKDEFHRNRFSKYSALYTKNHWMTATTSLVPRHAIEAIAFGSIILLVIYLLATHQDFNDALPLMALYAFTAYRLLPAFQQLFGSATTIRFNMASLEAVEDKLTLPAKPLTRDVTSTLHANGAVRSPQRQIEIKNLAFQYPRAPTAVIRGLSLTIPRNSTVAIVGGTGGGKTTLIDILLGLLEPQDGSVTVDGVPITGNNVTSWQKHLGYVPQHIYLSDNTIAANIAFGTDPGDVDMDRVVHAAQIAHIHDFVVGELPEGYKTVIGERGVRLSGGQRQRIGIARALYSDPEILILDEATSALDSLTEDAVTEAIRDIFHRKTIIVIAHRLRTVQQADIIYLLENGSIMDQGSYKELVGRNERFRLMAKEEVKA